MRALSGREEVEGKLERMVRGDHMMLGNVEKL